MGINEINNIVDNIFSINPNFTKIGSKIDYIDYISTIFKNSLVKDILYHGTMKSNIPDRIFKGYITYLTNSISYAKEFGFPVNRVVLPVKINVKNIYKAPSEIADVPLDVHLSDQFTNPKYIKQKSNKYDSVIGKDAGQKNGYTIAVFDASQIHILGDDNDLKLFSNFIKKNKNINKMKLSEIRKFIIKTLNENEIKPTDKSCWKGYKKVGTKKNAKGETVNDCRKITEDDCNECDDKKIKLSEIREFVRKTLNEEKKIENLKRYDVVFTLKADENNNFNGAGVVEEIEDNYVYVSTLSSWISALKYGSDWQRKNTVKLDINNVNKITKDNFKNLSHDSQNKYKIYIHLLKKYLDE